MTEPTTNTISNAPATTSPMQLCSGAMMAHAVRLKPGDDLVSSLQQAAMQAMLHLKSQSACILTAVGSVRSLQLRLANADRYRTWNEPLEIVSLVGTIARDGAKHWHMSVSDAEGNVFGGHAMSGTVHTTCEVVLGTIENVCFRREPDETTGYSELVVKYSTTSSKED